MVTVKGGWHPFDYFCHEAAQAVWKHCSPFWGEPPAASILRPPATALQMQHDDADSRWAKAFLTYKFVFG